MEVFEGVRDQLLGIIQDSDDFAEALCFLAPDQRTAIYLDMKNHLPGFINELSDFLNVVEYLDEKQYIAVCEDQKYKLPTMIHSFSDFYRVIANLSPEPLRVVYNIMRDKVPFLSEDDERTRGFSAVLMIFDEIQRAEICKDIKTLLNSDDFTKIIDAIRIGSGFTIPLSITGVGFQDQSQLKYALQQFYTRLRRESSCEARAWKIYCEHKGNISCDNEQLLERLRDANEQLVPRNIKRRHAIGIDFFSVGFPISPMMSRMELIKKTLDEKTLLSQVSACSSVCPEP